MKTILVISDLHLGGAPAHGDAPAFQMCTAAGRTALVRFLEWAIARRKDHDTRLVIAGDIVDFLAEKADGRFMPFTADDRVAAEKLKAILESTKEVWSALHEFVSVDGELTLMLGNHDLELSLPGPRRLLFDTLGPGRVEFLYDNQALSVGPVLIEHGNRYDDWNAVPHDDLREVRSRLSRGEKAEFDPLPGSRMVVDLVNPMKEQLSFVDLLKPEDATLLPFLALLAPDRYDYVKTALRNRLRALRVRYDADRQPKDRNFINAPAAGGVAAAIGLLGSGDHEDDALFALADQAAAGGNAGMVGQPTGSFIDRWRSKIAGAYREKQLDLLLETLRAFHQVRERAFDVEFESETYLRPATASAGRGYDVIVYGHTHLAKCIPLAGRASEEGGKIERKAFYFNSGTWADLIALPAGISGLAPASSDARARLKGFADDMAANTLDRWRRQLPTFVRIELDDAGGQVLEAALEMLDDGGEPKAVTTDIMRKRLEGTSS